MPESLTILLATTLISFAGSVQPGPVNLTVVQVTLTRNFKTGVWVALSGAFPEIIYSSLALKSHLFLAEHQIISRILEFSSIPFLLAAGFYSFNSPFRPAREGAADIGKRLVLKGFAGGILNPQLLPFWLVVLISFDSLFSMETLSSQFSFVFGAATGAFLLLLLFAYLAHRFKTGLDSFLSRYPMHKAIGLVLILLSLAQTGKILLSLSSGRHFNSRESVNFVSSKTNFLNLIK